MQQEVAPGLLTPFFALERAHRVPAKPAAPGRPPRTVVAKLLHYRDRDILLQQAREAGPFRVDNGSVTLFPDFTAEVQARRVSYMAVKRAMRDAVYAGQPLVVVLPWEEGVGVDVFVTPYAQGASYSGIHTKGTNETGERDKN
ncbi:hypothetical protein NDU88_005233 [Pleurodeles waltl]|uniref:Uncharacterized protein n=1 Tax=Pleurodeles waltl TaxID=8319 RepID=A0AAV7RN87_PLEWA|nr:hypothetical protein NDU88_005233 [Pleurodeles waltl]